MTALVPTIIASCGGLGGGSWSDSEYGPLLREAIARARVSGRRPRVLHLNTAGGDQRHVEGAELEAARIAGVDAAHLRLFPHPNVPDPRSWLLEHDVVWVSGGSLANLLALWRLHGLDGALREAWQAGVVLAGGSAGAVCWHEGGTTASFGPEIAALPDGLGFVPGSLAVHYDSDPHRRPAHRAAVADGTLADGYALDEGTAVVYEGGEAVELITEQEGGRVWRVERDADAPEGVRETALATRTLAA